MTTEIKPTYFFKLSKSPEGYTPVYDSNRSVPADITEIGYRSGQFVNIEGKRLVFYCDKIITNMDERFLRGNDVLVADGPSKFIFVKDRILNCMQHLVGRDIQIIPAEIYTQNGPVKEYTLINIVNTVDGIDRDKTIYQKSQHGDQQLKELFIKNEDFMEGHEIACDQELRDKIYIASTLHDKLIASKTGLLRGFDLVTTHKNEETRHIYLFGTAGVYISKYVPILDEINSVPSGTHSEVIAYGWGKRTDTRGMHLVFGCDQVNTTKDEERLRSYDLRVAGPGSFLFIHDRIMNCLSHLVDKDLQIIPAEIRTANGVVTEYHLIDVIPTVSGVDPTWSTYCKFTGYLDKLVPKNEDFMESHEMARERELKGRIYIIPALREKILKSTKGKLKGLALRTAKEAWEACRNIELCPY